MIVALCATVFAWAASPARAATFSNPAFETTTLASGLDFPTTVTWAPGGRMFIAEKFGFVQVQKADGTLVPIPIIDIHDHVVNSGDRGLLGLAAAPVPNSTDIKLYMLYTKRATTETDNQAADTTLTADATLTSVTVHSNNSVTGGTGPNGNVNPTETVLLGHETLATPGSNLNSTDGAQGCAAVTNDCMPSEGYTHTIGTVQVDPSDGTLWVSEGDGYKDGTFTDDPSAPYHLRAQDSNSLAGKILHVHTDGSGFTGSPFCAPPATNTSANCSKVWAKGFRNPFRFMMRQVFGKWQPVAGDVGEGSWEEMNDVSRGFNGGWPCWEGNVKSGPPYFPTSGTNPCTSLGSNYNHPFYLFDHYEGMGNATNFGGAIVGGPVYTGSTYPSSYKGEVFNTDYVHGWINFRSLSDTVDPVQSTHTFLSGDSNGRGTPFVSLQQAPDGNLVAVQIYGDPTNPGPASGSVLEIRYSPTNKSPTARATVPTSCIDSNTPSNLTVNFTGSASTDPEGDPLTYTWDFGDNSTSTGTDPAHANPSHTYAAAGTYEVRLKVSDNHGNSDNAFLTLHIQPGASPPNASITSPTPSVGDPTVSDDQYVPGRQITLSGGTTSGAGSHMSWEPVLVHGGTHTHVLGVIPTPTGDVPSAPDGVPAFIADDFHGADSYYLLRFTVEKNGCSTTKTIKMFPQTGTYVMDAKDQSSGGAAIPVPLTFIHTSIPEIAPAPPGGVTVAKNAIATVSAPPTWVHGGYTYTFNHWVQHDNQGDRTLTGATAEVQPFSRFLPPQFEATEGITAFYTRSNRAPSASISSPANGSKFVSGRQLTVRGAGNDPEDGKLGGSVLAWTIARTANGATQQLGTGSGSSINFKPDSAGDFHATYTITLTVTDSHGATGTTRITLHTASVGVVLSHLRLHRPRMLNGTLTGDAAAVKRLQLALRPAKVKGKGCIWWSPKRHGFVQVSKGCKTLSLLTARLSVKGGVTHWTLNLGAVVPPGSYRLLSQVSDRAGHVSSTSPGAGIKFTVTH